MSILTNYKSKVWLLYYFFWYPSRRQLILQSFEVDKESLKYSHSTWFFQFCPKLEYFLTSSFSLLLNLTIFSSVIEIWAHLKRQLSTFNKLSFVSSLWLTSAKNYEEDNSYGISLFCTKYVLKLHSENNTKKYQN